MSVTANGGSHTAEMKATLLELKKSLGEALESKASIEVVNRLQTQVDAIDVKLAQRHTSELPGKSLADALKENEGVSRILRDRKGRAYIDLDAQQVGAIMGRKSVISAVTSGSAGSDTLNPVGALDHRRSADRPHSRDHAGSAPGAEDQGRVEREADDDGSRRLRQGDEPDVDCFARRGSVAQAGEQPDLCIGQREG